MAAATQRAVRAANQMPDGTDATHGEPGMLAVGNGVLNLVTRQLSPHTPERFTISGLGVNYVPDATCPNWLAFVNEVMQGDNEKAAVLQEIFGATLDAHLQTKFFALLPGTGDNGKSVALGVLRYVLGDANVAAVPLEDLSGNRFASHALLGALANVVGDQGYFESKDEGKLKQLTGGDLFTYEQKGRDPIRAVNRAKMVFACNTPPNFPDKSGAIWNRVIIVPFDWTCPSEKKNRAMLTPAFWEAELPGILNWMLDGLDRLKASGGFSHCATCLRDTAELRADSNPVAESLKELYVRAADDKSFVTTSAMLADVQRWLTENGYTQRVNAKTLSAMVEQVFGRNLYSVRKPPGEKQARGYAGLSLAA